MKKSINSQLLFLLFLLFSITTFGQYISNQVNFGTASFDYAKSIKLADGNYLLGTSTLTGISGNKTSPSFGGPDYWIMKVDANNTILWQKSFGGNAADELNNMQETPEGHILLSGRSASPISGNKSVGTYGFYDYWILKLNETGEVIWQKNYGTSNHEGTPYITVLSDSNYAIVSSSSSNIDNDKTENSFGDLDYWVISIDSSGTILWDKTIGGSDSDREVGAAKFNTFNQQILIGGSSTSNISGNKTENCFGYDDIWIISLDLNGQIINQKTSGGDKFDDFGSFVINETNNEVFVIGTSNSPISGNKTAPLYDQIDMLVKGDVWLLKLNSDLNLIEDYSFGGDQSDRLLSGIISSDNQLIINGSSNSGVSGNKTEPSTGSFDVWLLSIDIGNGSILWQKTIGGNLNDNANNIYENTTSYKVVCTSNSPISGDKIVGTYGDEDFWLFDLDKSVGISEIYADETLVYPNPSNGMFQFKNFNGEEFIIYDSKGSILLSGISNDYLDLSFAANGVYFMSYTNDKQESKVIRLIKQ